MSRPTVDPNVNILIYEAWRRSEELHKFIVTNPVSPMSKWPNKFMFLATLCYASSLAKLVDMERDSFIKLATTFFDNVHVVVKDASIPDLQVHDGEVQRG
jgi:hypothetical protein